MNAAQAPRSQDRISLQYFAHFSFGCNVPREAWTNCRVFTVFFASSLGGAPAAISDYTALKGY
jgi:hypothetical protein